MWEAILYHGKSNLTVGSRSYVKLEVKNDGGGGEVK